MEKMLTYKEEEAIATTKVAYAKTFELSKDVHTAFDKSRRIGKVGDYYNIPYSDMFELSVRTVFGDKGVSVSGDLLRGLMETPNSTVVVKNLARIVGSEFDTIKHIVDDMKKTTLELQYAVGNRTRSKVQLPEIVIEVSDFIF